MREKEIISQLNVLKSIKPDESWVVESRNMVLSKAPCSEWTIIELAKEQEHIIDNKSNMLFGLMNFIGNKKMAVFVSIVLLFVSTLIVDASKSSLPGDSLYSVKIAGENAVLAITSEEKKAKIEIKQAGKRLEELAVISQKTSDFEQQQKVEQLIVDFEVKINNANNHLAKIDNNGEKVKTARVINDQSGKYVEILAKTTENLSTSLKEKVSDKFAKAIDSTEKINLSSLMVMVENKNLENSDVISDKEIKSKLKEAIEREKGSEIKTVESEKGANKNASDSSLEESLSQSQAEEIKSESGLENANASSESAGVNGAGQDQETAEKTKEELLTDAEANLESFEETNDNNDLLNAVKNVVAAKEIGDDEKINLEIMPLPIFDEAPRVLEPGS